MKILNELKQNYYDKLNGRLNKQIDRMEIVNNEIPNKNVFEKENIFLVD